MTRVKICGLTRRKDAELAIELGASAIGFVFEPSSPRFNSEVPEWLDELPRNVARVAVYGPPPDTFADAKFHAVQALPGEIQTSGREYERIVAVRLTEDHTVNSALQEAEGASAILLDAYRPSGYGGSGVPVDWDLAADIVHATRLPVILAGGLTPENVAEAIERVQPYAVDVSSGVESSPGVKDPEKLRAFFWAVRSD